MSLRLQDVWAGAEPTAVIDVLATFNVYLNRWTWILSLLAFGYVHLNRPMPGLRYATAAVFPWYILHQTITVVAGYVLAPHALGPVIEPFLVLGMTIGGCLVAYEYVIRPVRSLHPLFGVALPPNAPDRTGAGTAAPETVTRR